MSPNTRRMNPDPSPATIETAAQNSRQTDRRQTRWMMQLRRFGGASLGLAILAQVGAGLLLLPQSWLLAGVIHDTVMERAAPDPQPILMIGALILLRVILSYLADYLATSGSERIMRQVRKLLFADLLAKGPHWSAAKPSGAFSATIVDQVDALDGFFARFLPAMVQATFLPIAFALILMPFDWVVGLLFICTAPLIPLFMALVGWGAEAAKNAEAAAFTRLSGLFADRLRGILTLKLFGREQAEVALVRKASEDLRLRTMRVLRIAFLSSAVLEFFAALGVAGVALYVGLSFLDLIDLRGSILTLQVGLFCLIMAPEVYFPLRQLAAHYHDRAGAKAAIAVIEQQFDALPDHLQHPAPGDGPALAGRIKVRNLSVADTAGTPILQDLTLDLAEGKSLAITGPSGSGKTTLLQAIAGMRPYEGEILIGGVSLRDISEAQLRRTIAYLPQKPRIFHGSIADNIRLADPSADDARVADAARLAQVSAFADLLPQGLATPVGDGGLGLSGGEAHRVALARIYLRDPSIILLDEPTAHLDAVTEAAVLQGITTFAATRTLIVVTHSERLARVFDQRFAIDEPAPLARNAS